MKFKLASYLQREFIRHPSPTWKCSHESRLLPYDLEKFLGYEPRVDILMERLDGSQRLWIEFEISRADPVANHAKFATSHLFQPQNATDIFVSMISPAVDRGRRNLAANTILLMRHIGMNAFQTVLLPQFSKEEIQNLNKLPIAEIENENLDIDREIERVLTITEPVLTSSETRIHFASDLMDVMLNLRMWNEEIQTPQGSQLWGKRTITYFVFDPVSYKFAPSKFCAYVAIPSEKQQVQSSLLGFSRSEMTINLYITLDGQDTRFDGRRAWLHLTRGLMMNRVEAHEDPSITEAFHDWLKLHQNSIKVHPHGAIFLCPPKWFK